MREAICVLMVAGLLSGCCGGGESSGKSGQDKPTTSAAQPATAATTAAAASTAPPKVELPPGRTAMPTLTEWNTMKKEVTVKGSSALSCETKMVREYLRVSCHGKNDTGGTPTAVKVIKGGRDVLAFSDTGVASLIVPFVEGVDLEAVFSWTDKSHKLEVTWPKGAKMPVVLGVFEGAASPLDASGAGLAKTFCDCHQKVTGEPNCDEMMGAPNDDCLRTYKGNCGAMLACARGEPGVWARCQPGFVNAGAAGFCVKDCTSSKSCPAGSSCEEWGEHRVCFEQ